MSNPAIDESRGGASGAAILVLAGTMLLSFVLGSIHSFSVLLPAMEETFGASRTSASLTYSFALITLAFTVLLGHRAYSKISPAKYVAATGFFAAAGCLIAGIAGSVPMIWIGYSLLFGGANGLGYGYALQFSAQVMPARTGFAMGAVTAAYALGAVVFPMPLNAMLKIGGWTAALISLALATAVISAASAALLARSRVRYKKVAADASRAADVRWQTIALLWFAYGCAVTAGLMVIAHATGVAKVAGASAQWVVISVAITAASNMVGSLLCGAMLDRFRGPAILTGLAILSSTTLVTMALLPHVVVTMTGLAIIGLTYGGTISVYPAFISKTFGAAAGTIIYGRVFTAWAAAGLLGPGLAGLLYDRFENYSLALIVAAVIAILSLAVPKMPTQASM
jgi:OFA family oxalate/formate antiporter-like MFS transporter